MTSPAARRCARNARTSSPIPRFPHLCARTPRTSPSRTRARSQRTSTRFSRRPSPAPSRGRRAARVRVRAAHAARGRTLQRSLVEFAHPRARRTPAASSTALAERALPATSVVVDLPFARARARNAVVARRARTRTRRASSPPIVARARSPSPERRRGACSRCWSRHASCAAGPLGAFSPPRPRFRARAPRCARRDARLGGAQGGRRARALVATARPPRGRSADRGRGRRARSSCRDGPGFYAARALDDDRGAALDRSIGSRDPDADDDERCRRWSTTTRRRSKGRVSSARAPERLDAAAASVSSTSELDGAAVRVGVHRRRRRFRAETRGTARSRGRSRRRSELSPAESRRHRAAVAAFREPSATKVGDARVDVRLQRR